MSKIIHQIAISDESLKDYTPPNMQSINNFFSDYDYIFWDYRKLRKHILKSGDTKVMEAIDSVKANAFKADIARYYILHNFGGWYTDLNNFFVSEPCEGDSQMVFFRDVQELTKTSWAVQVSLFYAQRGHKILSYAVDSAINNVANRWYGGHALCPTGPNLFGSVIASQNLPENNPYIIGNMKKGSVDGFYVNGSLFAKYKPNNLLHADSGLPGGNNYERLWTRRELY